MIGRYLYANHVREDVKCSSCGAVAVAPRVPGGEPRRISHVLRADGTPWFIYANNPRPTNLSLRAVCECGAAVDFCAPGDVELFTDIALPAKSGTTPLTTL
jgi:hypothetical protein